MSSEEEREAWKAELKERYGIRCIGDEERPQQPAWPDYVAEGDAWQVVSEYAMASPDLVHWYEKPDGMTMAEFTDSLPEPVATDPAFEPCRVYWGSHGCDLERGHAERDGTPHDCGCCDCGEHHPYPDWPDEGVRCVAKPPYYGDKTRFYGEDATPESAGRWGQVMPG